MLVTRFLLLVLLVALTSSSAYLLKHRKRYEDFLENKTVNLILVITYNLSCYLIVVLPSEKSVVLPSAFFEHTSIRTGFPIIGSFLAIFGGVILVITLKRRKAIGGQDVGEGLITSGIYQYSRHPIYTGITLVSLGLPLITKNLIGLLMFPGVLLVNMSQGIIEEKFDLSMRFPSQYEDYRKRTAFFGPIWCWIALGGILFILCGISYL